MNIGNLYAKSIDRRINPVAVVSELEVELVKQEIEEYVFTPQIYNYLYSVLDKVVNQTEGKTGVWINGYYGSGKSHFLKYIYYSLNNTHSKIALEHLKMSLREESPDTLLSLEVTDAKLAEVSKKLGAFQIETIMFNIDAVSGSISQKEAITKVFLNQLNLSQGYNGTYIALAKLERQLDKQGKLDDFKSAIQAKFKEDWNKKSADLIEAFLDDVLQIAKVLIGIDVNSVAASIERALSGKEDLSVVNLVQDLTEYLESKPTNYRLMFLIDEVSQYIGTNLNLLLNLQSIVEEVGSKCGNKIWILCTAQQEIKDVISGTGNSTSDFGKIMARFETRISLQSQNFDDIIKKRILEKNSNGIAELTQFYSTNKTTIENQFLEINNLYKTFADKTDFINTYPFIPYQFHLVSDVFESFSSAGFVTQGVKNTERSLLGITHFTAKENKDQEVGYIMPFDAFFNAQLTQNLTILATNKLDRAYRADDKLNNKFAKRVIHALFMLSYLKDNYQKNIPATLDNLVTLLMDKVDQDKLVLQKNTNDVLEILQSKSIIIKGDNNAYRFLGDDEIIVLNDIRNTKVTTDASLDIFYKDLLENIISLEKKVKFDDNYYEVQIKIDDKEINTKGDLRIQIAVFDTSEPGELMLKAASNDMVVCLNQNLASIRKDFTEYVQIVSYIKNNSDTSNKARLDTLREFKQRADLKLMELRKQVEDKFLQSSFISTGQIVSSQSVVGATAKAKYANALQKHLEQVYKKKSMANSYAQTEDSFRKSAQINQMSIDENLLDAEREVNNILDMMPGGIILNELVNKLKSPPYGWKDVATMDVLLQLGRKNKRKFMLLNEPIDLKEYAEKALNIRERGRIEILPEDVIDRNKLFQVVQTVNTVFNQSVLDAQETDANVLFSKLTGFLKKRTDEAEEMLNNNASYPFAGTFRNYHSTVKQLSERREKLSLFNEITSTESNLKPVSDAYKVIREFVDEKIEEYKKIKSFVDENVSNFSSLSTTDQEKGEKLIAYFGSEVNPQERFMEVKKAFTELNKAVSSLSKELRDKALLQYNEIFDMLESKAAELGLAKNSLPERQYWLDRIKKLVSIPELRLKLSNALEFQSENITNLFNLKKKEDEAKGKQNAGFTMLSFVEEPNGQNYVEIRNEAELEEFIRKFRERALAQLKQNKIVGLK
jgi:hypothetical protein